MSLLLETTFGDLVIDLDVDGSPALCKNVLKLAKARYYTNTLIYNIVPGKYCQLGGESVASTVVVVSAALFSFPLAYPSATYYTLHIVLLLVVRPQWRWNGWLLHLRSH